MLDFIVFCDAGRCCYKHKSRRNNHTMEKILKNLLKYEYEKDFITTYY